MQRSASTRIDGSDAALNSYPSRAQRVALLPLGSLARPVRPRAPRPPVGPHRHPRRRPSRSPPERRCSHQCARPAGSRQAPPRLPGSALVTVLRRKSSALSVSPLALPGSSSLAVPLVQSGSAGLAEADAFALSWRRSTSRSRVSQRSSMSDWVVLCGLDRSFCSRVAPSPDRS